jgi:hypothetical protein
MRRLFPCNPLHLTAQGRLTPALLADVRLTSVEICWEQGVSRAAAISIGLAISLTWIVGRIDIFNAKRADKLDLHDRLLIFAGDRKQGSFWHCH